MYIRTNKCNKYIILICIRIYKDTFSGGGDNKDGIELQHQQIQIIIMNNSDGTNIT